MKLSSNFKHVDLPLVSMIFGIILIGMIALFSGSEHDLDIMLKQSSKILTGFILMIMIAKVKPHTFKSLGINLYVFSILMLICVKVFGTTGKGAQRWLNLGVIKFQPSEILKLTIPLIMASWLDYRTEALANHFISFLILLFPCMLILIQPDLGTAILVGLNGLILILIAGLPRPLIWSGLSLTLAAIPWSWFYVLHDYQKARIITFLNPGADSMGSGYHIIQSKIATGSGGIFGKGWLNGTQSHLAFLPEHTTDFVFGIIGEEFGLFGAAIVISLILMISFRILDHAERINNKFNRLVCCGIATNYFFCSAINIGMVIGIFPVVGIPLPLVSYGGTSATILLISFGIVLAMINNKE